MQFNFYGRSDDVVLSNWLVPELGDAPEAQRQHGQPVSTVTDSVFSTWSVMEMVIGLLTIIHVLL